MNTRQLLEKRAGIVAEMRGLTANGADLSDEQRARFDTLKAEADALQAQIDRQAVVDDLERRMQGQPITGTGDGNLDRELRSFSLVRAIAAQVPGLNVDAGRERELSQEIARRAGRPFQGIAVPMAVFMQPVEQRVQTVGTNTAGGYLVGTDHRGDQYIDLLRKALVIRGLGARVLSGLVGNVEIPKQTGANTAGWVAENTTLTATDMTFGSTSLTPKHVGCLTELSRNMLMQASPDIESLVRADFAAVLAEAMDTAAINGSGTGAEPTGILNTSGIGSVALGTNGAAFDMDDIIDLMGQVEDANADTGAMAFVSNMKVKRMAAKLKNADAEPFGLDKVFQGVPRAFSNVVPSNLTKGTGTGLSALIYGNWSDLILAYWSELDILVNPFETTAYKKGNVQIRGMLTADIAVRHVESFAAMTDITA